MGSGRDTPLERTLAIVGDRWSLQIVSALLEGPKRFGELQEGLAAIAPNVLSQRLKHLERNAVLLAEPYSTRPLRVIYRLTATGAELAGALRLLAEWGATGNDAEGVRHVACGSAMEARWWCPTCDEVVVERDVTPESDDLDYA